MPSFSKRNNSGEFFRCWGFQLSVISYQLSVISYQLSVYCLLFTAH
ncbi:hypothetical protein [Microcystis aeruginosa]|nr:hypothetical protein [Microcystis aeruginosa]